MKQLINIFIYLSTIVMIAQNDSIFKQGNELYNKGKFLEAINTFESILDNNMHSAELYFNLANSYYKLNQIASSIYYYEKALQLSPKDMDIINNLGFAQNMTIDSIETLPEIGFSKFMNSTANKFSFDIWAKVSVVFVLFFMMLFLSYYFSYSTAKKRMAFIGSFLLLGCALMTLLFAFHKYAIDKNDNPAIVFAQESDVKVDPNLRSESSFQLHEGTKVQVLERYNDTWIKIKIANGKNGWILTKDIKLLNDI